MLFRAFPKADEGELSRRLADLVRKEACADVARAIELGAAIRLGASEANAGGRSRTAILADVCEALIGAVFVDGGYGRPPALIERLWEERMRAPARPLRDAKTVLQEWAQARGLPTPAYREVERKGPDHDPGVPRHRRASRPSRRPKGSAAPSAPPSRPPPPPCSRARASSGPPRWLSPTTARTPRTLRLHRADRRAQCRQIDADQRAGRHQGGDRLAQGADHARLLRGIATEGDAQLVFIDTPGIFRPAAGSTAPW